MYFPEDLENTPFKERKLIQICFGQVQIRAALWTHFYNLDLSKMIWSRPKQIGSVQSNLDNPKSFWTYKRTKHSILIKAVEGLSQSCSVSKETIDLTVTRWTLSFKSANITILCWTKASIW
jgi:hypothetical protein